MRKCGNGKCRISRIYEISGGSCERLKWLCEAIKKKQKFKQFLIILLLRKRILKIYITVTSYLIEEKKKKNVLSIIRNIQLPDKNVGRCADNFE